MFVATCPTLASRRRGLAAVLVVVWALAGGVAKAGHDEEQQRALLDLIVNEAPRGQVLAIVRAADILVSLEALERVGLGNLGGRRETIEALPWVSLKSLAPGITFQFDERTLVLRLTAQAQHMVNVTRLDFRDADRPNYERAQSTSAFVNYGADWRTRIGLAATGEAGLSLRGSLAMTTVTWREGQSPIRGLSSVTFDNSRLPTPPGPPLLPALK